MPPLVIAAGTPDEIEVWDVRHHLPWAKRRGRHAGPAHQRVIWHHSVTPVPAGAHPLDDYDHLLAYRGGNPWGWPYNFVVFPSSGRVWYLCDVDEPWPHTLGQNGQVAICAIGNYDVDEPGEWLLEAMRTLTRAVWRLWSPDPPVVTGHRDHVPTACPGQHLYPHVGA